MLARFKREAQAAGRLNHPNIVAIYDYGEATVEGEGARIAFIAMEFVKGKELKDYFEANERFAAEGHRAHHGRAARRARSCA